MAIVKLSTGVEIDTERCGKAEFFEKGTAAFLLEHTLILEYDEESPREASRGPGAQQDADSLEDAGVVVFRKRAPK